MHTAEGEVVIVGPGRLAGSMTVEAAEESIDRLKTAVDGARDEPDPLAEAARESLSLKNEPDGD